MWRYVVGSSLLLTGACSDQGVTKHNADPTAQITSHTDGDVVAEGHQVPLRGVIGDPDSSPDELSYTWLVGGVAVCGDGSVDAAGVVTCEHAFSPDGTDVVLEVRDAAGGSAAAHLALVVTPSDAPTAEITQPTADGLYYAAQLMTFAGTVADAEDDPEDLHVLWETDVLGDLGLEVTVTSEGQVEAYGELPEGEHAVRLVVTDTSGKEGIDSVVIDVGPPNSAPACAITAPASGEAGPVGQEVLFEGSVSDVDIPSDWLAVAWASDKDGPLGKSNPSSWGEVAFPFGDLSVNPHTVTMTVTDELGATCSDFILYTVGTPPILIVTTPTDGDVVNEGALVEFGGTVFDAEDLPTDVTLSWSSDIDGEFSTAGADSGGVISFAVSSLSSGEHLITARATDPDGLYSQTTFDLVVNALPTAPTVTLSPDPAYTSDTLVAGATGSVDPDVSGTISYTYAWYEDGILTATTGASFAPADTAKHHTYKVVATPSDGIGEGPSGEASITVANSAPILTLVSVSPSSARVGEAITCSSTWTDADGDAVTESYAWSTGDVGATLWVGAEHDPGDVLTCTVTIDDGDGGVDVGTASATVADTPPEITSVDVEPAVATESSTLTCTATGTDGDGDAVTITYGWKVSGVTSAVTGPTLDGASFDKGDDVVCTATPDGGSPADSASVPVVNTPPVQPPVTLGPIGAVSGDLLVCDAPSPTDVDPADAGLLSSSFAWTADGADLAHTGATLDSTGYAGGTPFVCTVTPWDPEDPGTPVSSLPLIIGDGAVCEDDGSSVDCPGLDCLDIYERGLSVGDGLYWIDPSLTGSPYEAYCDMTTDGGGWTLLVSADGASTYWGNNSPNWYATGVDLAPATLDGLDHHGRSYDEQPTDEVRLCREGVDRCFTFTHELGHSLWDFFDGDISYVAYSSDSYLWADEGTVAAVNAWEAQMGATERYLCQWLGINYTTAWSAIGMLSDNNYGCESYEGARTYPYHDDGALGLGLQSCEDDNGCFSGGSGHLAGQSRFVGGVDASGVIGPWYVFGRRTPVGGADGDGDGYLEVDGDCDDGDASVFPLAGDSWGDGIDGDCDGLDCEAGWVDGTTYLALCDLNATWTESQGACWAGGHDDLATLDAAHLLDYVDFLMGAVGSPVCADGSMGCPWIGAYQGATDWQWIDGTVLDAGNWAPAEPTGDGDCVHYNRYGVGAWNDSACDAYFGAVCETVVGGLGSDPALAATDCVEILDADPGSPDGVYWLSPDGGTAIEVYCDMTTDGGGWALLSSVASGPNDDVPFDDYAVHMTVSPIWIEGGSDGAPLVDGHLGDVFQVYSQDWRRFVQAGVPIDLRQRAVLPDSREADIAFLATPTGYVLQDDAPDSAAAAWPLTDRRALAETIGIGFDTAGGDTRFWLPFTTALPEGKDVWTGCAGGEFANTLCVCAGCDPMDARRYGNAGIINGTSDNFDPAFGWAPHTNAGPGHGIAYAHRPVGHWSELEQTLQYWMRPR